MSEFCRLLESCFSRCPNSSRPFLRCEGALALQDAKDPCGLFGTMMCKCDIGTVHPTFTNKQDIMSDVPKCSRNPRHAWDVVSPILNKSRVPGISDIESLSVDIYCILPGFLKFNCFLRRERNMLSLWISLTTCVELQTRLTSSLLAFISCCDFMQVQ